MNNCSFDRAIFTMNGFFWVDFNFGENGKNFFGRAKKKCNLLKDLQNAKFVINEYDHGE